MHNNRHRFCESDIGDPTQKLNSLHLAQCVILLLILAVGSITAAAQCPVFVPGPESDAVSVFNTANDTLVATIPVGHGPWAAASFWPHLVYVTNTNRANLLVSNSVSVIDTSIYQVVATVPVGTYPVGVAVTPNGASAYVTNYVSNTVSVINTS